MADSEREWIYITPGCVDARDLVFSGIPETVSFCLICHGNGKYKQWYIEGQSTGPCGLCESTGFIYKASERAVPLSVLNQIAVASGLEYRRYELYGIDWKIP